MSSLDNAKQSCAAPDETDSAVEKLLLKKNGSRTTMTDLKELLIAVNHDSRARDLWIIQLLEDHAETQYHVTKAEFDSIIADAIKRQDEHDFAVKAVEQDVDRVWEAVKQPEDEEMGDLRRAWRFIRWFVAAGILVGLDLLVRFLVDGIPYIP